MSDKPAYLGTCHQDGEGPHVGTVECYPDYAGQAYARVQAHTRELCRKVGIEYDDVEWIENINDPGSFARIVRVKMKSGEEHTFTVVEG